MDNNINIGVTTDKQKEQPDLVRKIGKTTYLVKAHFSTTNRETMSDKIKRMCKVALKRPCGNEVSQMK
jgi:hypothetical protein